MHLVSIEIGLLFDVYVVSDNSVKTRDSPVAERQGWYRRCDWFLSVPPYVRQCKLQTPAHREATTSTSGLAGRRSRDGQRRHRRRVSVGDVISARWRRMGGGRRAAEVNQKLGGVWDEVSDQVSRIWTWDFYAR